jgi:Cu+-exporting ATPase
LQNSVYASPEHFIEMAGRGIFGKVNNLEIRMGSEEFVCNPTAEKSKRTSVVFVSVNNVVKGHFTISNVYREGFEKVIETLKNKFKLYLVSGDNDAEAQNLAGHFDENGLLFNQKPGDKAEFIKSLQEKGEKVLMTGDGLNDADAG